MGDRDVGRIGTGSRPEVRAKDVARIELVLALESQRPMRPSKLLSVSIDGKLFASVPRIGNREKNVGSLGVLPNRDILGDTLSEWWVVDLLPVLDLASDAGSKL